MTYDPSAPHDPDRSSVQRPDAPTAPEDPARRGEQPPTKPRRGPASDVETWAARVVVAVSNMDLDGATAKNSCGFSLNDSDIGNSIAGAIAKYGPRLTEKQWPIVVRLATRYAGQVPGDPRPSAPVPPPAPIPESPETEALKAQIRAGEARLDALLADPDGPRCLSRESGGIFGQCGSCGLELGPGQAKRDKGRELVGKDFAVCTAIPWLAERRAKLARLRGDEALAREIEVDIGLAQPAAPAPASTGSGGATAGEVKA